MTILLCSHSSVVVTPTPPFESWVAYASAEVAWDAYEGAEPAWVAYASAEPVWAAYEGHEEVSSVPPPPPVWAPTDIAGLTFWIKADNIAGLNDGDPVSTWVDASTNALNATQATAAQKPTYKTGILNGKPVVRFDGVDDQLNTASVNYTALFGSNTATIFIVQRQVGTQANNLTLGWWASGTNRLHVYATYADTLYFDMPDGAGGRISVAQPAGWDDSWRVLRFRRSATVKQIYSNTTQLVTGTPDASALTSSSQPLTLGTSPIGFDFLKGDIAELLIYNTALSDSDCALVETYLNSAARWAVY